MKCWGKIQRRTGIIIMSKNAFSKWRGRLHVSYARYVSWILNVPSWYVRTCYVKNINHMLLPSFILRTSYSSLFGLGPVSSFRSFSSLWRDLFSSWAPWMNKGRAGTMQHSAADTCCCWSADSSGWCAETPRLKINYLPGSPSAALTPGPGTWD